MSREGQLFILAGNGSYENRGCEAIVRGTTRILRHHFESPQFLAVSSYTSDESFEQQRLNEIDSSIKHKKMYRAYKRFDRIWFLTKLLGPICPGALKHITYKDLMPYLGQARAVLAVGGDNYSLDYSSTPVRCTNLDDLVTANGKPLVIWGASVGPFSKRPAYEKYMINHLRKVYILARESFTIEYLANKGLTKNVYRVADPAFLMEPTEPDKEKCNFKIEEGAVGLNFSPLIKRFIQNCTLKDWTKKAADILISILQKTDRPVYLIPHVCGSIANDDYIFLKEVFSLISKQRERIILIPPLFNAPETKWIISKMNIFAGARTHSTIASLSSCVPTLSFAYSMKAKGLNSDIFGHVDYCISSDKLYPDFVAEKIKALLAKSEDIKIFLKQRIPEIEKLAMNSGAILKEILSQKNSC